MVHQWKFHIRILLVRSFHGLQLECVNNCVSRAKDPLCPGLILPLCSLR